MQDFSAAFGLGASDRPIHKMDADGAARPYATKLGVGAQDRGASGSLKVVPNEPSGGTRESMGRYDVLQRLASGGMAEVSIARARGIEGFQKVVALKRILPHAANDPEFIRMFLDEARLAANLDHPNVVGVHDIGRADDEYFFTMEFIHGETLGRLLASAAANEEQFPLSQALFIASEVAAGLHHAHERIGFDGKPLGIIHRDVSPSNVLVSYEGAVKVADFGIAKASCSKADTVSGVRKGKTPYMSPEQCRGQPLDRRADVWSLGVVLYEMLVGLRPFRGTSDYAVMEEIVRGTCERPSALRSDVPAALDSIIERALCRDPQGRYATARALQTDLLAFAREHRTRGSAAELAEFLIGHLGKKPLPWEGAGLPATRTAEAGTGSTARTPTRPAKEEPRLERSGSVARPWMGWLAVGVAGFAIVVAAAMERPADSASREAPTLEESRIPRADTVEDAKVEIGVESAPEQPVGETPSKPDGPETTTSGPGGDMAALQPEADVPAEEPVQDRARTGPPKRREHPNRRRNRAEHDDERDRDEPPVDSGLFDSF